MSRMQTVGLKLAKDSEGTRDGKPVVYLRMEATNPLFAPFLKPLLFTVEAHGQHRILEYTGRASPRVLKNGKWVELDALTVFSKLTQSFTALRNGCKRRAAYRQQ